MAHLRNIFRFGWPYLHRYWPRFALGILLGVVFGLSNASFIWATKTMIGRMAPPKASPAALHTPTPMAPPGPPQTSRMARLEQRLHQFNEVELDPWLPKFGRPVDARQMVGGLLLFPLLIAFRGYIGYFSSYCLAWVSERVVSDLRIDVLRKLTALSLDFFNRSTMGDLLTRVNTDAASLQRCLSLGLSDLIKEPVTIAGVLLFLLFLDWKMTLAASVFFPLVVVPIVILGRKVRRASNQSLSANINQSSLLVEMLSGIRVIKAFGLESRQVDRFTRLSRELVHHVMKFTQARELVSPMVETIAMLGFGALIVYVASQQLAVDDLAGFLTGLALLFQPIKKLGNLHVLVQQTSVGVDRIVHLLQEKPTVVEPECPAPLPAFERDIVFDQVDFAYGKEPVLRGVSLRIPRGQKLGIAGESGCGKSTLVNLLFRFYDPTAGSIRIDGLDLKRVPSSDLRQLMALVSQEIVLFDQTVAENIACGSRQSSPEAIEKAARSAFAEGFILELPQQYHTRVGEQGLTLSGGQRQRLAIARAFIRDAPILVLDEATASLDSRSEAEVQSAIDRLSANRTVVCIAHRLSTLAGMDQIIVLDKGRIIERGTFEELLQQNGAFAAMAARQGIGLGHSLASTPITR